MVAGVAGAAMGVVAVKYWEINPIVIPDEGLKTSRDMAVSAFIYAKFKWAPVFLALTFSAVIAVLASVWPARWAANQNPADAVRAD